MHRSKRFVSILLVLMMILSALPLTALGSFAVNRYVINGKVISVEDSTSEAGECWQYANSIYKKIWGGYFTSDFSTSDNFLRDLRDDELTLTAEHLKQYVSAAEIGAVLRICNAPNLHANDGYIGNDRHPGHSQIIVQKDEDGFTVIQGGLTEAPHRSEAYYTWQDYATRWWLGGRYSYIKYIKWSSAPSYAQLRSINRPILTDAVYPGSTAGNQVLLLGQKFPLSGMIYSSNTLSEISARVYDMAGNELYKYEKRLSANSYNITREGLDNAISFGLLPSGGYTFEMKATDILGARHTLVRSFFTVAASKVRNEEKIYNFLINNGFSIAAACGVLANIEHESYFNPLSLYHETGGFDSHGLIQWNHGRYDNLVSFCAENGYDVDSMEGQLRFMMRELQNVKQYAEAWEEICNAPNTAQGAYDVAYDFCYYYEIPDQRVNRSIARGELAQQYFERYTRGDAAGGNVEIAVGFNARGGSECSQTYARFGKTYGALPTPKRDGYEFLGWFTEPEGGVRVKQGDTVWVTMHQVLYAHWKGRTYTIYYHFSEDEIYTEQYVYGSAVVLPKSPMRDGFSFDGWYENADFSGEPVSELSGAGNKNYYAKWAPYTGLLECDDGIRYYERGEVRTGTVVIGRNTLYFDKATGLMQISPIKIDGEDCEFEEFSYRGMLLWRVKTEKNGVYAEEYSARRYKDNVMQTGWYTGYGYNMYFSAKDGLMVSETTVIDGKPCSFEEIEIDGMTLWREVKDGLYEENGGVRYYIKGSYQTGWVPIDGQNVYFNRDNGLMVTEDTKIQNHTYSFEPFEYEGFILYGSIYKKNGFFLEDDILRGVKYYIDDERQYGWQYPEEIGGKAMFFDRDSGNMWKRSGVLDGAYREFGPMEYNGFTLYYVLKNGFEESEDGIRYYEHDECVTGFREIEEADGALLYFNEKTGLMVDCDLMIGGFLYRFEPFEYNGMTLYKTAYPKNGLMQEDDGVRFYVNDVPVKHQFIALDGETTVYFDADGKMFGGSYLKLEQNSYRFDSFDFNGITVYRVRLEKSGFYEEEDGVRYYVNDNFVTGKMQFPDGLMYFSKETGLMVTSRRLIDDDWYDFEPFTYQGITLYRAILIKNGFFEDADGIRYYVDDRYQTGFYDLDEDSTLYFDQNGIMFAGRYLKIEGQSYRFAAFMYGEHTLYRLLRVKNGFYEEDGGVRYYRNGEKVTGFLETKDGLMYFDPETGMMLSKQTVIDGAEYSFTKKTVEGIELYIAKMLKNGFYDETEDGVSGTRYYVHDIAQTGFVELRGDVTVYFDEQGFLNTAAYLKLGEKSYRFEEYPDEDRTLMRLIAVKNGLYEEDGGVRLYKDGAFETGFVDYEGEKLCFAEDGLLIGERTEIDGEVYIFERFQTGEGIGLWRAILYKNGIYEEDGGLRYYIDAVVFTGMAEFEEIGALYFDGEGLMYTGAYLKLGDKSYRFEEFEYGEKKYNRVTPVKNGFYEEDGGLRYYTDNEAAEGFVELNDSMLYFAQDGLMNRLESLTIEDRTYSFEKVVIDGFECMRIVQPKNGVYIEEDGIRFYVDDEVMTGFMDLEEQGTLYFDEDGLMFTGTYLKLEDRSFRFEAFEYQDATLYRVTRVKNGFYEEDGGLRYYTANERTFGFAEIDGWSLYFDADGLMFAGESLTLEGQLYIFEKVVIDGFECSRIIEKKDGFYDEDGGVRFYVSNEEATGFMDLEGQGTLYFDENGLMFTGTYLKLEGQSFRFEPFEYEDRTLHRVTAVKNGFYEEDGGLRYYAANERTVGFAEIDGWSLYFDEDGMMFAGEFLTLEGQLYIFEKVVIDGFECSRVIEEKNGFYDEDGGVRFYVSNEEATGFMDLEGQGTLYFDENGLMFTGAYLKLGGQSFRFEPFEYEDRTLYRVTAVKNGFYEEDGGLRYYVDGEMATGFVTVMGSEFYFDDNGLMNTGTQLTVGEETYDFEKVIVDGFECYRTTVIKNGVVSENGGIRFYENGEYLRGIQSLDGNIVYFGIEDGYMVSDKILFHGIAAGFAEFTYGEFTLYRVSLNTPVSFTINDITALLVCLSGSPEDRIIPSFADANGDGKLDISDVTALLRFLSGAM